MTIHAIYNNQHINKQQWKKKKKKKTAKEDPPWNHQSKTTTGGLCKQGREQCAGALTLSAPKFQTTLSSALFSVVVFLNKLSVGKKFICKVVRLNAKQRRS